MREILFRGKTPSQDKHFDDGEWVQGFYTCFNGKEHRIYSGYSETDCGDYYPDWCNVRPETVGRYTGLTDKNGKKIFEGDIVEYARDEEIGEIAYHESEAMFVVEFDTWLTDFDHMYGKDLEVIGNIHDTPELLRTPKNDEVRE